MENMTCVLKDVCLVKKILYHLKIVKWIGHIVNSQEDSVSNTFCLVDMKHLRV